MKKHVVCYLISVFLVIGFAVKNLLDYRAYTTTLNSAPFEIWILVNGLCFLLPALIVAIIGIVLHKKSHKNQ